MDPITPRCHRSKPRLTTQSTKSSSGVRRASLAPSTPRNRLSDFYASTPSTVQSDSTTFDDDFPFDSSGEWSIPFENNLFQTPKRDTPYSLSCDELRKIQACSPLVTPQQRLKTPRCRRSLSIRTENSNESSESHSSPRRRPRRTSSTVKLEDQFLVLASESANTNAETSRQRRSSSIEPRRRRTSSMERRLGNSDLSSRRRLSMTKMGSAPPLVQPETLTSPAARRLARHTQSLQQLSQEKPLLRCRADEMPLAKPTRLKRIIS